MKERTWIFPVLILILAPFVWYSSQPGIDEKRGIDILLNPVCFISLILIIVGCVLLRNKVIFLMGNLLFILSVFWYVYNQGKMFEGNLYTVTEIASDLQPIGVVVLGIAGISCIFSVIQMMRLREKKTK